MARTLILRIIEEPEEKYRIPKTKYEQLPIEATIGRGSKEKCYIQIVRDGVSRNHATIYLDETGARIKDNNSTNGTYINGKRVLHGEEVPLKNRDSLWLGLACPLEVRVYQGFLGGIARLLRL